MKNYYHSSLALLLLSALILGSCTDTCETISSYTYYEPVFMNRTELRDAVELQAPREINQSGKIYFISDHLFINEPGKGIHIINNSNPESPKNIGFINIPGNFDLAAVDGYLYADSYIDLVVLDISDLSNPHEVHRVKDLFPNYNSWGYYAAEDGIVTDWVETKASERISTECDGSDLYYYDWGYRYAGGIAINTAFAESSNSGGSASPGIGGSMARFTVNNNHLFMIDESEMKVANIDNPANPMLGARTDIGWGIETIFPYEDMIFIGANDGMYIYDVSTPFSPNLLSNYSHVRSCDPVVTDGKYAYVTLRSGTQCQGFTNQLEIIDIENPSNPQLLETYPMYNPHGLSISDNRLFICDGEAGLKIYDGTNIHTIDQNLIKHYGNIHAYDVIVNDCLVMLVGEDGLNQYHCNDFEGDITYLSTIEFSGKL
ncbi:LVIVD repeat-containing protein [Marinoscillum sp.]|uniref:LVIVD repeat-containing protein n=1 Tax=Marinoscillum sp. TaxID=2024838 RepID=UPI003BA8D3CD